MTRTDSDSSPEGEDLFDTDENGLDLVGIATCQKLLLEGLLSREWLAKQALKRPSTEHPAVVRWLLACRLASDPKLHFPDDRPLLPDFARLTLDSYAVSVASGGSMPTFAAGDFRTYGDDLVRRWQAGALRDADGFQAVMTELVYAAGHIADGHQVEAHQQDGHADFVVHLGDGISLVADCKRLVGRVVPERYASIIKKTNNQVKKSTSAGTGIAFIDATEDLTDKYASGDLRLAPERFLAASSAVRSALRLKNRSVGAVVLMWDECNVEGSPGVVWSVEASKRQRLGATVTLRRMIEVFRHDSPRVVHAVEDRWLAAKYEVEFELDADVVRTGVGLVQPITIAAWTAPAELVQLTPVRLKRTPAGRPRSR